MELNDILTVYTTDTKKDIARKEKLLYDFIKGFTDLPNSSFWDNDIAYSGCAIINGYMDDWDTAKFCSMKDISKNVRAWAKDVVEKAIEHAEELDDHKIAYSVSIHDHEGCGGLTCVLANDGIKYDKIMIIPTDK